MEEEKERGGGQGKRTLRTERAEEGKRRWRTARSRRKVRRARGGNVIIHIIHTIHHNCLGILTFNIKLTLESLKLGEISSFGILGRYSSRHCIVPLLVAWFFLVPPELEIACTVRVTLALALATNVGVLVWSWGWLNSG